MKININTTSNTAPNTANSEPEYIYHWDRIGFVLVAILAICVGLGFGFSKWSQKHGSASLKPNKIIPQEQTINQQEPQLVAKQTIKEPPITPTESTSKTLSAIVNTQPKPEVAKQKPAVAKQKPAVAKQKPEIAKVEPQAIKEALKEEPKTVQTEPQKQTEPQEQTLNYQQLEFIQKRTQILDESVTRYVTAAGVKDREPVGSLKTLTHRKGGVARVYVFADVQNFKGETIQYHWYQNDNLLAKVDIEVKGNRWRNKTFQNIGPAMTGTWRVELMFGEITLAKTEFLVKRIDN